VAEAEAGAAEEFYTSTSAARSRWETLVSATYPPSAAEAAEARAALGAFTTSTGGSRGRHRYRSLPNALLQMRILPMPQTKWIVMHPDTAALLKEHLTTDEKTGQDRSGITIGGLYNGIRIYEDPFLAKDRVLTNMQSGPKNTPLQELVERVFADE
jgi:hypothetical protein